MTEIPEQGIYPIVDRLSDEDKRNSRSLELYIAFNKTVRDHCDPLLQRLQNLQNYWTANEEDLKHILKRDFGDYFGEITETGEEKRVFIWQIYEMPFYKHSLDILSQALAQLNLADECVDIHQYYWNPEDAYSTANYVTKDYIEANGLDIGDYVALSEITVRFDEYHLLNYGRDAYTVKEAVKAQLERTMGYHIQMNYIISESGLFSVRSLVFGNSRRKYSTTTIN